MSSSDFDYQKSALILYNMHADATAVRTPQLMSNLRRLIDACHAKGKLVTYAQMFSVQYEYQSKYFIHWLKAIGRDPKAWSEQRSEDSLGGKIVEELKPTKNDIVFRKHVADIFVETNAEIVFRNNGVETLIFSGIGMEHGIESVVRHSTFLGFMPAIAEDAVVTGRRGDEKYAKNSIDAMRDVFACDVQKTDYIVKKIMES